MNIEEYIEVLRVIAAEHPGAWMMARFDGDDYHEAEDYAAHPEWSERDKFVYVDYGDDDT